LWAGDAAVGRGGGGARSKGYGREHEPVGEHSVCYHSHRTLTANHKLRVPATDR
jgi:hypothetical protein